MGASWMAVLVYSTLAIGGILVLALWGLRWRRPQRAQKLPPGPKGAPLLGGLLQLSSLRDPGEVARLVAKYGPVFSLRLGSIPLIFVGGRNEAHQALVERGQLFASRPRLSLATVLNRGRTINSSVYGSHWRTTRRCMTSVVATKLHRYNAARTRAVDRLLCDLKSTPVNVSSDKVVIVRQSLRFAVFSILAFMCFGKWLDDEEVLHLEKLMREVMKIVANPPSLLIMMLQRLRFPTKAEAVVRDYAARRSSFFGPLIDEARRQELAGELDPNCYLHALFQEERTGGIREDDILILVAEFLNAGGDTTAVTLEWALARLILHPDVQHRLFEEISEAGADIGEDQALQLSYLGAFIKEVLRMHPPGFSTLPHAVTEPTQLAGHDIPKNAILLFHIYTMGNDPEVWEKPSEFRPERFLEASATLPVMSYAPFGAGRRVCPGMPLADLHLHYILARLVQTYEWSRNKDGGEIDMTPKFEFTAIMNTPLVAVIRERSMHTREVG